MGKYLWQRRISFMVFALLAFNIPVMAQDIEAAQAYFNRGDYSKALDALRAVEGTSDAQNAQAFTLQSEIISTQIMLGQSENPYESAIRARQLSYQAVVLIPESSEAYIHYALALGLEARTASVFKAWRKKLPEKCKPIIQEAYNRAREDARPSALMGAWHFGIVRKAGDRRALKMYDASIREGIKWYDAALKIDPDQIIILSNFAFSLLGTNDAAHTEYAAQLLAHAQTIEPVNAIQTEMKRRIDLVVRALKDDNLEALKQRIDAFVDIGE